MASLNEGVIMGASYIVTPERHGKVTGEHADDICDLNAHIFNGLCESLFDLDQALVCSSSCNLEKMACGSFICFYILQPSHYGLMLLKRLAGSEEVLPMPSQLKETVVSNELKNCIQASLSKVEVRDYNPLEHERGLHRKLNWFVKESLQCGSITAKVEASSEPADLLLHQPTSPQNSSLILLPEEENEGFPTPKKDEKMPSSETGDWEHLIIDDKNHSFSPSHISQSKPQSSTKSQSRTLDERTCKILERLEVPKQQRQKASSPNISVNSVGEQMKKPLLPFDPSSSQPFRPSFQRSKRKLA
ncbi:hypothetical protein AXF42_Ash002228 [Apostasia shenzhenica]|uniref:Uncharacterized protein n=1 Tax=Apostasia shenzhenica TaxID=1088818 RepID=A0A2I0AN61_9ASPA|nr:hypothetical protein AXF42_Ash002228 [Apostasia shenzhenica]